MHTTPQSLMSEIYKKRENCYSDLRIAINALSNPETTREQFEQIEKTLTLMYLNCHSSMNAMIACVINEYYTRIPYFIKRWAEKAVLEREGGTK